MSILTNGPSESDIQVSGCRISVSPELPDGPDSELSVSSIERVIYGSGGDGVKAVVSDEGGVDEQGRCGWLEAVVLAYGC